MKKPESAGDIIAKISPSEQSRMTSVLGCLGVIAIFTYSTTLSLATGNNIFVGIGVVAQLFLIWQLCRFRRMFPNVK